MSKVFPYTFFFFFLRTAGRRIRDQRRDMTAQYWKTRSLKGCRAVNCSEQSREHFVPLKNKSNQTDSPVSNHEVLIPWLWWQTERWMGSSQTGTRAQTLNVNAEKELNLSADVFVTAVVLFSFSPSCMVVQKKAQRVRFLFPNLSPWLPTKCARARCTSTKHNPIIKLSDF